MPMTSYYEEAVFDGEQITDTEIAACSSEPTLTAWFADCEACAEDIVGQIEGAALAGSADPDWVYRATKSMGFFRRAQSRIRTRMLALGILPPDHNRKVAEANRKVEEIRANANVALYFMRLAKDGAMPRHEFARLEAAALEQVEAHRLRRKAAAAAAKAA